MCLFKLNSTFYMEMTFYRIFIYIPNCGRKQRTELYVKCIYSWKGTGTYCICATKVLSHYQNQNPFNKNEKQQPCLHLNNTFNEYQNIETIQ